MGSKEKKSKGQRQASYPSTRVSVTEIKIPSLRTWWARDSSKQKGKEEAGRQLATPETEGERRQNNKVGEGKKRDIASKKKKSWVLWPRANWVLRSPAKKKSPPSNLGLTDQAPIGEGGMSRKQQWVGQKSHEVDTGKKNTSSKPRVRGPRGEKGRAADLGGHGWEEEKRPLQEKESQSQERKKNFF